MGTKTQTNTANQYNPAGMSAYNAFQPGLQSSLLQMAQNPLSSSYFQNALAQMRGSANQIAARGQSNQLSNARTGGGLLSNSGGFTQALTNRSMLANSQMQSNAFNSALGGALQNRNWALSSMEAYQPLQTGQNTTQSTGGLGTWLPQLAGAALGGVTGALTGGMSGLGGGGGGGGAQAMSWPTQSSTGQNMGMNMQGAASLMNQLGPFTASNQGGGSPTGM